MEQYKICGNKKYIKKLIRKENREMRKRMMRILEGQVASCLG